MPAAQNVRVNLAERSYDIEIGTGNLPRLGRFLAERGKVSHAIIITDENVQEPHALAAAESLAAEGIELAIIAVKPGEPSKAIEVAAGLWQGMLDLGADRKTVVVAVGGGVVGDLAGFIAATYARGLRFLQVPTTLLAQVDSSVGGKVGINLPEAKNMVGAFLQPLGVLIDTATLDTLPDREYHSGLGEVIKYGVILDAELFAYLEAHAEKLAGRDPETLVHVIARCCRLKADVVEQDEREEAGERGTVPFSSDENRDSPQVVSRAVLNYGHTFGHALETLTGYGELLHGEAVAMGMMCAARLAERLGRIDAAVLQRQRKLLEAVGLPVRLPKVDRQKMLAAMQRDKKVAHGKLRFVLPDRLGHVELVQDVGQADVRAALNE